MNEAHLSAVEYYRVPPKRKRRWRNRHHPVAVVAAIVLAAAALTIVALRSVAASDEPAPASDRAEEAPDAESLQREIDRLHIEIEDYRATIAWLEQQLRRRYEIVDDFCRLRQ